MPDADLDAPGMRETTAGALQPAEVGRVVHLPRPPIVGVLTHLQHGVDSPPLPSAPHAGPALRGATHVLIELPSQQRGTAPVVTPAWLEPQARVIVDDRLEVGVCALCGQQLLRTADDCWHPWTAATACPPEPPLHKWPAGFRSGRPGRDNWRPRP